MSLQQYINTFNSSNKKVYQIDPLQTFDVSVRFTPASTKISEFASNIGFSFNKFGMFIQSIRLPDCSIEEGESINTLVGNFSTHQISLTPSSRTFSMEITNTKAPILENIIYPWIREISSPIWSYSTRPYTIADMDISLHKHNNVTYKLIGVRPIEFNSHSMQQQLGSISRDVTFTFDFMLLQTSGDIGGFLGELGELAKKLGTKVLNSIGL